MPQIKKGKKIIVRYIRQKIFKAEWEMNLFEDIQLKSTNELLSAEEDEPAYDLLMNGYRVWSTQLDGYMRWLQIAVKMP
jgi:hypothetical protein